MRQGEEVGGGHDNILLENDCWSILSHTTVLLPNFRRQAGSSATLSLIMIHCSGIQRRLPLPQQKKKVKNLLW